jgi:GTPase
MDNFKLDSKFKNPPKARQIRQENDLGNIEYKWTLSDSDSDKLERLLTQMNYRFHQGNGEAIYNLGYMDNGEPKGLPYSKMLKSLGHLFKICEKSRASIKSFRAFQGIEGYCVNVYIIKAIDKCYNVL